MARDNIKGGLAAGRSPKSFNQVQLRKGTTVELEHVVRRGSPTARDRRIAREIAMDHLAEHADYYKHLEIAERKMTKAKRNMPAKKKSTKRKSRPKAKWRSSKEIEVRPGTFLGLTSDTGEPYLFNVVGYIGTPAAIQEARKHGLVKKRAKKKSTKRNASSSNKKEADRQAELDRLLRSKKKPPGLRKKLRNVAKKKRNYPGFGVPAWTGKAPKLSAWKRYAAEPKHNVPQHWQAVLAGRSFGSLTDGNAGGTGGLEIDIFHFGPGEYAWSITNAKNRRGPLFAKGSSRSLAGAKKAAIAALPKGILT